MEYEIIGGSFPIVECTLKAGEAMITQSGSMAWMDPTIKMETSTNGGIGKVVGRLFTKEALFQNIYVFQRNENGLLEKRASLNFYQKSSTYENDITNSITIDDIDNNRYKKKESSGDNNEDSENENEKKEE